MQNLFWEVKFFLKKDLSTEINDIISNKPIRNKGKSNSRHRKAEKKQKNKSETLSDADVLYNNLEIKSNDGYENKKKPSENSNEENIKTKSKN